MGAALEEVQKQWLVILLAAVLPVCFRYARKFLAHVIGELQTHKGRLFKWLEFFAKLLVRYAGELSLGCVVIATILMPWPLTKWVLVSWVIGVVLSVSMLIQTRLTKQRMDRLELFQLEECVMQRFVTDNSSFFYQTVVAFTRQLNELLPLLSLLATHKILPAEDLAAIAERLVAPECQGPPMSKTLERAQKVLGDPSLTSEQKRVAMAEIYLPDLESS